MSVLKIYLNHVNLKTLRIFLRSSPFEVLEVQFSYFIGLLGIFTLCTYLSDIHFMYTSLYKPFQNRAPLLKAFLKDFIFLEQIMIYNKIERKIQQLPICLLLPTCIISYIISIAHQIDAFFNQGWTYMELS